MVDVQRGGPSTGLPTKTEQSDLLQAMYGRNGDCPLAVIAACTPGDCFDMAIEAVRIATKYMTPVILLTDGFLANSAEPWKIPDITAIKPFPVQFRRDTEGFHPSLRDPNTLARTWAVPGTPGLEHRIGGIEKHHLRQHLLRPGQPPQDDQGARRARSPASPTTSRRRRSNRAKTAATSSSSAGAPPSARSPRPCSAPAAPASRSRTCTSAT
jgi:hypothetical protein